VSSSDLAILVCGEYDGRTSMKNIFDNLSRTITALETNILTLPAHEDSMLSLLGPFYGRSLIETTCIALIGRIDPFKLLVLEKIQQNYTEEDFGTRSKIAINWAGDVFESVKKTVKKETMWSSKTKNENVSRSLLDLYYAELFWAPAYTKLIDSVQSTALEYYKSNIEPDGFVPFVRRRVSGLYSTLSKGIHNELIIDTSMIYDRGTVIERLKEVIDVCSILAITCHQIDSIVGHLPQDQAVQLLEKIYDRREKYGE
jgi:hypothetical protein